ncbi:hypothetical protein AHAS_Ahas20G0209000 [Arachis hypogaea]
MDGYQEILRQRNEFQFDWDSILPVIAQPETCWTQGRPRLRPKGIDARILTVEAQTWAQILSHYVFPSTHKSSITADLAFIVWCILTEKPVNIPPLIRQAMGRVHAKGNLPFPALVSNLVVVAGVPLINPLCRVYLVLHLEHFDNLSSHLFKEIA